MDADIMVLWSFLVLVVGYISGVRQYRLRMTKPVRKALLLILMERVRDHKMTPRKAVDVVIAWADGSLNVNGPCDERLDI